MQNAVLGDNFTVYESARCHNESKKKNNIVIGNNVELLCTIMSEDNGIIEIGDYTTVRSETRICSINHIKIGNYVIISNNVVIQDNNSHPTDINIRKEMSLAGPNSEKWKSKYSASEPIIIEDSVWIGEKSVILKGVRIGTGSIVACNSVVTKDIPSGCIAAGNPAKIVKKLV